MAREWDRARLAAGANLTGREQRHAQLLFGRLADRRSRIALVEHLIEAQPAHRHFGATAQARVMRRHALVPDAQERIEVDRLAAIVLGLRVGPVAGIRALERRMLGYRVTQVTEPIGRAHVRTPVRHAHLRCRLLLENNTHIYTYRRTSIR